MDMQVSAGPKVVLEGASVAYGDLTVLKDVDLVLGDGEFLSIVGPSGCGKSTLLKLISGLEPPAAGRVFVDGAEIDRTPPHVGFMFQRDALLPWATAEENINVGLELGGYPQADRAKRCQELIDFLQLTGFGKHYPSMLSGGMRQRVSLGRLLAYEPELYLMDEPFGALDAQTKVMMGRELLRIWGRYRKSVIFVTHDIEEAVSLSSRVIVISGRPGRVKREVKVDIDYPRDLRAVRKTAVFHDLCSTIWDEIMGEKAVEQAADDPAEAPA
ncbi:ABC transporter ATP-binding protein [Afifella sp. IM 167]|uniref:ABC transporter ATP-binding protein n=1 Tax=Afifella sp. IM 167 TaxID=2033586 RepID=UPI001CCC0275|nr:ABC transporter ATP-binding protein [Afifella sp. IM 167]MBZ8134350.1 ABC transporter ATP-binding protein [Afifella sp. IM 167]